MPSAPRPFPNRPLCGTLPVALRPTSACTAYTLHILHRTQTHSHAPDSIAHGRRSPSSAVCTSPPADPPRRKRIVGFRCTDGLHGTYLESSFFRPLHLQRIDEVARPQHLGEHKSLRHMRFGVTSSATETIASPARGAKLAWLSPTKVGFHCEHITVLIAGRVEAFLPRLRAFHV